VRILVLRALGLGDLLTAVPALRALRAAYPRDELALACPRWLHELVQLWELADTPVDVGPLQPIPRPFRRPGVAVNLHGRGPESTQLLLDVSPSRLIAFRHAAIPETWDLPVWTSHEAEIDRWCRLLNESGIAADPERLDLEAPDVDEGQMFAGCTVVHPGAAAPARRWPAERWASVVRFETAQGRVVVLSGSSRERGLCLRVAAAAELPEEGVLAGSMTLVELAALVGSAGLVVCGDTGVAHLATAFGTPSIVLFGPVSPAEWGPPAGRRSLHRPLWAGRRGNPHAGVADSGLLQLTPELVVREIQALRTSVAANARRPLEQSA
jgi:ADP-heptose:LPS heptosyltransferase